MSPADESASPFVGLRAFKVTEAGKFGARTDWTRILVSNVLGSRLTVLHGKSGVGKSSLLRAGLEHSLSANGTRDAEDPKVVPLVWPPLDDAVGTWRADDIIERLVTSLAAKGRAGNGARPTTLHDAVRECSKRNKGRVVLILDQFE